MQKQSSNVITRRTTGICLGLIFTMMCVFQGWFLRIAVTLLGMIGMWEMYTALEKKGSDPVRWLGIGFMAACLPIGYFFGIGGLFVLMAFTAMLGVVIPMLRNNVDHDSFISTVFPILYPGIFFCFLMQLTNCASRVETTAIMCLTYGVTMLNDVFAYEIGTKYGKHHFAPRLSPKKTTEGSLAGLTASVLASAAVPLLTQVLCMITPLFGVYEPDCIPAWWLCAIYGLVTGVLAQVGDLTASLIKRYCGIKDYGTIFPGHGGVMDRLDGILFSGLCSYVLFILIL